MKFVSPDTVIRVPGGLSVIKSHTCMGMALNTCGAKMRLVGPARGLQVFHVNTEETNVVWNSECVPLIVL